MILKHKLATNFQKFQESSLSSFAPVLIALSLIWLYFGLTQPAFFSARNFYNLFMQSIVVGTLAVGITIILLLGDIDLSAAAVAGSCAALMAVLIASKNIAAPLACLIVLGVGVALAMFQGLLIAYVRIPSFVVTLAGLLGFQGLMQKILGIHGALNVRDPFVRGITTTNIPKSLSWLLLLLCMLWILGRVIYKRALRKRAGLENAPRSLACLKVAFMALVSAVLVASLNTYRGVPLALLILFGITTTLWWVSTSTPFGRALFAVGGNAESARRVGISVPRIRLAGFAIVGFMAAVGGIIGASRYASVSFNAFAGGPLLLEAIGAAVIGGTSLFGGRGSVWNAIIGALVIGSLGNGLDLSGASAADKLMVSGAILLLAVTFDALSRPKSTR